MGDVEIDAGRKKAIFRDVPEGVLYALAGGALVAAGVVIGVALLDRGKAGSGTIRAGAQLLEKGAKKLKGL